MDRLLQLEVFAKTAELNSLSKAAETLGMSNAAASRHLSALEERLATRLIERGSPRWVRSSSSGAVCCSTNWLRPRTPSANAPCRRKDC